MMPIPVRGSQARRFRESLPASIGEIVSVPYLQAQDWKLFHSHTLERSTREILPATSPIPKAESSRRIGVALYRKHN
jgi:hypothetical protein